MSDFPNILVKTAREALRKLLGETTAATIDFYCDPAILAEDPDRYQKELEKIFGIGANILRDAILRELHDQLGLRYKRSSKSLANEIAELKGLYRSK